MKRAQLLVTISLPFLSFCKPEIRSPDWRPSVPVVFSAWFDKLADKNFTGGKKYELNIPAWFTMGAPPERDLRAESVELGRFLFYEKALSRDNTISCGSCHIQKFAFSDNRRFSKGVGGRKGTRNSMSLANLLWDDRFFWDGRAPSLEAQVLEPIHNPVEMDLPLHEAIWRLEKHPIYPTLFRRAFGEDKITEKRLSQALAQFIFTLVSYRSPLDYWSAVEGYHLPREELPAEYLKYYPAYVDATKSSVELTRLCGTCHSVAMRLGQKNFDDIGLDENPEAGFQATTGKESDRGKFKTLSLRNIMVTGPYMHDGRFDTIEQVFDHYENKVKPSPNLDFRLRKNGKPLRLKIDPKTRSKIINGLSSFTDWKLLTDPRYADPFN